MTDVTPRGPATGPDDGASLRASLTGLDEQGRVDLATGVLMWRHRLDADAAAAMLVELAGQRGVSVVRMADLLQPSDS